MATTFSYDALPLTVFATGGNTSVNLLDLLTNVYGDQVSAITNIQVEYRDASFLANAPAPRPAFTYWDPANPVVTRVLNNGVDVGGQGATVDSSGNAVWGAWNPTTLNNADFHNVTIDVGNNIMPNVYLTLEWANNGTDQHFQELAVTTVPGQQTSLAAFDGMVTANDIVTTARAFATAYNGVANANDCHWMATTIAGAAGATLDPATQNVINPGLNEDGGFWRVAHRGSDNAVDDWQTLVQPGDIVRMGWTASGGGLGGFHTVTVTEALNAAGQIRVVDNTGPLDASGNSTIAEHWVDFDGNATEANSITIYRISLDQHYLVNGSNQSDTIIGSVLGDHIKGGEGNDTLIGGAGNDILRGHEGTDTLRGGEGNDSLDGDVGSDTMEGGHGDDTYFVDDINDIVLETDASVSTGGSDIVVTSIDIGHRLWTGIDNLVLVGSVVTGDGNDLANVIQGNEVANTLLGREGRDKLMGYGGEDTLDGGNDADWMEGGTANDTYFVDNTDDVVVEYANGGIDSVMSSINYALGPHLENLILTGSATKGAGNDLGNTLTGNAAANVLDGQNGDDVLNGAGGEDILRGGSGADTLTGGTAKDTFVFDTGWGKDRITDFIVTNEVLDMRNVSGLHSKSQLVITDLRHDVQIAYGDNSVTLAGVKKAQLTDANFLFSSADVTPGKTFDGTAAWGGTITGTTGVDTVSYATATSAIYVDLVRDGGYAETGSPKLTEHLTSIENLTGASNSLNYLHGSAADNVLIGGDAADWLTGRGGSNTLDGRGGVDLADYLETDAPLTIDLTIGKAFHSTGTDTLISIENARGTGKSDVFIGSEVDNYFHGMNGMDAIRGNGGNDWLEGSGDDDTIDGGSGNDKIVGGSENDVLTGGSGADSFLFRDVDIGHDRITDFHEVEGDRIDFSEHTGVNGLADLAITTDATGNTLLSYGGSSIVLEGVAPSAVSVNWFLF